MPEVQKITAWSYSRYSSYEQCPFKTKLTTIDKLKEPQNDALAKGVAVHSEIERYLKLPNESLPQSAIKLCADYEELKAKKPYVELEVCFNKDWQSVDWFAKDAWVRIKVDALVKQDDYCLIVDHKGLAINTEIPTPSGFTTMGDLQVGDTVFDMNGQPCVVTHKSKVKTLPMYEIQFKDGAKVQCDIEHIWAMLDGGEKTTPQLVVGDCIPMQSAIVLPDLELPIHPYVLGYWLGNGRKRDGSICAPAEEIYEIITACGYTPGPNIGSNRAGDIEVRTIAGLRTHLAALSLLNNKHIPAKYLRASIAQRQELLRGLMDSDGSVNMLREEAVFSNTNRQILKGMRELLSSLGIRFRSNTGIAKGFGLEIEATQIAFRAEFNCFKYSVKASKAAAFTKTVQNFRRIKSITQVEGLQSQCIGVDSPTRTYLCTNRFIVTHNTGRVRDSYEPQLELYALTGLLMFPSVNTVDTELWFVDAGRKVEGQRYTRNDLEMLKARWTDRVTPMLEDVEFRPTPNQYCRSCHFSKSNAGICEAA